MLFAFLDAELQYLYHIHTNTLTWMTIEMCKISKICCSCRLRSRSSKYIRTKVTEKIKWFLFLWLSLRPNYNRRLQTTSCSWLSKCEKATTQNVIPDLVEHTAFKANLLFTWSKASILQGTKGYCAWQAVKFEEKNSSLFWNARTQCLSLNQRSAVDSGWTKKGFHNA